MIIQHDWEKIARYVKSGKAHELSERDFMYLSPARKGAGGDEKVKYNDKYPKAKPRAYSFKKSYMTKLFNERMLTPEEISYILPDIVLPKEKEFDDILIETLKPYFGRTVDSLKRNFTIIAVDTVKRTISLSRYSRVKTIWMKQMNFKSQL